MRDPCGDSKTKVWGQTSLELNETPSRTPEVERKHMRVVDGTGRKDKVNYKLQGNQRPYESRKVTKIPLASPTCGGMVKGIYVTWVGKHWL